MSRIEPTFRLASMCARDLVVALVVAEAERQVRLDGVEPLVLERVGAAPC